MQHGLNGGRIPCGESLAKAVDAGSVCPGSFPKPVLDQVSKQLPHFPIGQRQPHLLTGQAGRLGQVAGGIEDAPDIVNRVFNVPAGQLLPDGLDNALAAQKALDFFPGGLVRLLEQAADDAVTAGVGPVVLRLGVGVSQQNVAVIDDVPGTVDVDAAKEIAVVPVVHGILISRQAVKGQQLVHVPVGETEIFVVPHVGDGVDFKVVQTGKDALLRDAQTAGQDGKLQAVIGFQGVAEQVAEKGHHLVVVTGLERLVQRNVILVD